MNCPRCNNAQSCKDGIVRNKQRYQESCCEKGQGIAKEDKNG